MAFEVPNFQTPFQIQQGMEAVQSDNAFKQAQIAHLAMQDKKIKEELDTQEARGEAWRNSPLAKGFTPASGAPQTTGFGSIYSSGSAGKVRKADNGNFYVDMTPSQTPDDLSGLSATVGQSRIAQEAAMALERARQVTQTELSSKKVDPKAVETAIQREDAARTKKNQEEEKLYALRAADIGKLRTEISSALNSPDRKAALAQIIQGAMTRYGSDTIRDTLVNNGIVNKDTGEIIDNPFALHTLQRQLITAEQDIADRRKAIDQERQEKERLETLRHNRRTEGQRDLEINLSQQRLETDWAQNAYVKGKDIAHQLDSNPVIKNFETFQVNKAAVDGMLKGIISTDAGGHKTLDTKAWKALPLAQQQTILSFFKDAQDNFERNGRQSYTDEQFSEMNGRMRNAYKALTTWGSGTPKVDAKTMGEVLNAYDIMHSSANTLAVTKSLDAYERMEKAQVKDPKTGEVKAWVDPTAVQFKGSLAKAVKDGTARIADYGGRKVVVINDRVVYPLPSQGVTDAY